MSDPIHKLELNFDGGTLTAKLICPEKGCMPPGYCSDCGRDRGDTDREPCTVCTPDDADYCNAKEWFDAAFEHDWITGDVTVDVEIDWDSGEGPTFTIVQPVEAQP